ncbi:hypothetical protein B0T24DRAFT_670448 [Lasiosphaeria ovina]|uniref:Uncharacterized protein n=1 Tax=Lasiosphaeria ovina TaxID=92902 RepID=A0AAE0JVB7_9PEZI|nr:hypothetical protein B0T24DRAFT_670448 [Lasiosphaeria ovina]
MIINHPFFCNPPIRCHMPVTFIFMYLWWTCSRGDLDGHTWRGRIWGEYYPRRAIPSYYRCTVPPLDKVTGFYHFMPSEAGYDELRRLFGYLRDQGIIRPHRAAGRGHVRREAASGIKPATKEEHNVYKRRDSRQSTVDTIDNASASPARCLSMCLPGRRRATRPVFMETYGWGPRRHGARVHQPRVELSASDQERRCEQESKSRKGTRQWDGGGGEGPLQPSAPVGVGRLLVPSLEPAHGRRQTRSTCNEACYRANDTRAGLPLQIDQRMKLGCACRRTVDSVAGSGFQTPTGQYFGHCRGLNVAGVLGTHSGLSLRCSLGAQQAQQVDLALRLRVGHVDDQPVPAAAAHPSPRHRRPRLLRRQRQQQRLYRHRDLSIDLEEHSSVTSCLQNFSAKEMLYERNKFHCDHCGGLQEAESRHRMLSVTPSGKSPPLRSRPAIGPPSVSRMRTGAGSSNLSSSWSTTHSSYNEFQEFGTGEEGQLQTGEHDYGVLSS